MTRTELPERIETERLVLRVRTVADAEDIHAYASLPEVSYPAGFPPVKTLEDEIYYLEHILPERNEKDNLPAGYGIVVKGTNNVIGSVDLKPTDKVFDPTCGTAGFLIAAMHDMLTKAESDSQRDQIRKHQLFGIEEQSYMFTIATTNMILRGDGKSNLENQDFLRQNPSKLQLKQCNVGMMNPPYSMGSTANTELYEINFTEHLLNSLVEGAKAVVIVPQSTSTGKTRFEKETKQNILKHHTLEGVITLNKNTFYGVGTNPCIAVFTAGIPHRPEKECKFINFENDGFEVSKHIGLVETATAKDKKQHLLDVWFDRTEAETKFCVQTTIEADDEWLHSFYYFNDEVPSEEDFQKTIADYLTFEVNMITHGRGYLFGIEEKENYQETTDIEELPMVAEKGDKYE